MNAVWILVGLELKQRSDTDDMNFNVFFDNKPSSVCSDVALLI